MHFILKYYPEKNHLCVFVISDDINEHHNSNHDELIKHIEYHESSQGKPLMVVTQKSNSDNGGHIFKIYLGQSSPWRTRYGSMSEGCDQTIRIVNQTLLCIAEGAYGHQITAYELNTSHIEQDNNREWIGSVWYDFSYYLNDEDWIDVSGSLYSSQNFVVTESTSSGTLLSWSRGGNNYIRFYCEALHQQNQEATPQTLLISQKKLILFMEQVDDVINVTYCDMSTATYSWVWSPVDVWPPDIATGWSLQASAAISGIGYNTVMLVLQSESYFSLHWYSLTGEVFRLALDCNTIYLQ